MKIRRTHVIAAGLICALAASVTVSAQKDNNGNPTILAAVQAVETTVNSIVTTLNSLVTTVNGIDTAVNAISATTVEGNILFTPALVAFPPDSLICTTTNVSSASRNVTIQLVNGNTGAQLASATSPVAPGLSTSAAFTAGAGGTRAFCKITVNDGVKNDVRGVLAMFGAATASDKDPVVAF